MDWDAVAADCAELLGSGPGLAAALRRAAHRVDAGESPDQELGEQLGDYLARHRALLAAVGGDGSGATRLAEVRKIADEHRESAAERRRTADRESEITRLRANVAVFAELLESATGEVLDHVRAARAAAVARLGELGAEPPEPPDPAEVPAPQPEPRPEPPPAPEPEREPSPVPEPGPEPEPVGAGTPDHLAFPWEIGDPPLVATLVRRARLAEAYWLTTTSFEPDRRADVLRHAAAAFDTHTGADATALLTSLGPTAGRLADDHEAAVVAAVALLRAALVAGWGPQPLNQLVGAVSLPAEWSALLAAAVAATRRGVRVDPVRGAQVADVDADAARLEIGRRADKLALDLPKRRTLYQRASNLLRWFMRDEQPVCQALQVVVKWSTGAADGPALAAALAAIRDRDALIENADAATHTPKLQPIVAEARRMLLRNLDEVVDVVAEALAVDGKLVADKDREAAGTLSKALAAVAGAPVPEGVGGAAIGLFRSWLEDPAGVPGSEPPNRVGEPRRDVLLVLPDLPRTADGRPDPDDRRTLVELAGLVGSPDPVEAAEAYFARGDLASAAELVARLPETSRLREDLARQTEVWTRRHAVAYRDATDLLARVRTQNLLETDETLISGRLQGLATVRDGAFHVVAAELARLTDELRERERRRTGELRVELDGLELSDVERHRITALLDAGDTVTATEFVAFVRAGDRLPEHEPDAAGDLQDFVALLDKGHEEGLFGARASATSWARLAAGDNGLLTAAEAQLAEWDSLSAPRNLAGDRLPTRVKSVLRLLGLVCDQIGERGNRQKVRVLKARAHPTDGAYVAELGSAALEYDIVVVTDERRGRSVLEGVDPGDRATVVLCLHPLDLATRRGLSTQSGRGPARVLVVDPAVVGWVAATAPGSWRATQRITLPWAAFNPYRPFVAGLVPPEVFVGREEELREVTDPAGGLFVYGGRQLGKSALLHRAQANFDNGGTRHAVYLDLKGRGIGESEPAVRIWRELAAELKERGVLGSKVSDHNPSPKVVADQVRAWLAQNPARRVLLLADEADAFLTADSRATAQSGGVEYFPNVSRLKELIESTDRRFKVVFAGLHQVQRFSELPNVPLTHGGPGIPVGPLDPRDARRLVIEPMAALGYQFERPELVWRLLAATNYQASLVQIFGEELVRVLQRRGVPVQGPPTVVTEADVDGIAAGDKVRNRIAERLRITINLEDRYRVLTLVIALHSLEDAFGASYPAEGLLQEAREAWPAGFDGLSLAQVTSYLDEMVGLGLLVKLSGGRGYAIRSPNVVTMLGTRSSLRRELADMDFDLAYEYNPRSARRLLDEHGGAQLRSPLTDGQLAELTRAHHVAVVTGTRALGLDRVPQAVRDYAEARGSAVRTVPPSDVVEELTRISKLREPRVLLTDVAGTPVEDALELVRKLVAQAKVHELAVVVVAPAATAPALADAAEVDVERLARWTVDTIRSWPECPFDVPKERARLIDVTGGWPELVEDVIARTQRGASREQALRQLTERCAAAAFATRQLAEMGVDDALRARLGSWHEYVEPGERVNAGDVASVLDLDQETTNRLLDELDLLGVLDSDSGSAVVSLDRVVHRCLRAIRASG
ncbi:hypothetical protein [Actinosynnema sp. NPDC020468]|uniref:hypothetical protein n=1 Tax=Actinosynnema sp. NPDC020468 TaxID=3154488 RepID=UPI0033FE32BE